LFQHTGQFNSQNEKYFQPYFLIYEADFLHHKGNAFHYTSASIFSHIDGTDFLRHKGNVVDHKAAEIFLPLIYSAVDQFMHENSTRRYIFRAEKCMGQQCFQIVIDYRNV
jgi:hypothetical protein